MRRGLLVAVRAGCADALSRCFRRKRPRSSSARTHRKNSGQLLPHSFGCGVPPIVLLTENPNWPAFASGSSGSACAAAGRGQRAGCCLPLARSCRRQVLGDTIWRRAGGEPWRKEPKHACTQVFDAARANAAGAAMRWLSRLVHVREAPPELHLRRCGQQQRAIRRRAARHRSQHASLFTEDLISKQVLPARHRFICFSSPSHYHHRCSAPGRRGRKGPYIP